MTGSPDDSWADGDGAATWDDLVQPDVYVVVPVCPGLLVVEAQGVQQLVLDHGLVVAARPQGQDLPVLLVSHAGEAPGRRADQEKGLSHARAPLSTPPG